MSSQPRPWDTFRWVTFLLTFSLMGCGAPLNKPEESKAPVKVVSAESKDYGEWTELTGTTQPLPGKIARISAAVEGHVHAMPGTAETAKDSEPPHADSKELGLAGLREGRAIKAGQVIVQLDDRIARANRDKGSAMLLDLDEQAKQAQFVKELAQIDLKRLEELSRSNATGSPIPLVSRIELEKAKVVLKDAESKQQGVVARQESARQELKALEEHLQLYTLRSPIAGRLDMTQVVLGQTVAIGATVAEVIDLHDIDVLCFVPPHLVSRLAEKQEARLTTPGSATANPLEGEVVFISFQAQPDTGNFAVKIRFPNPDGRWRANSVVNARVLTQPVRKRFTIPEAILMEDQDPPALIVAEDVKTETTKEGKEESLGKAHKLLATKIGVRDRDSHRVEILELTDPKTQKIVPLENLTFISEGGHGLKDGDTVKIEAEKHAEE